MQSLGSRHLTFRPLHFGWSNHLALIPLVTLALWHRALCMGLSIATQGPAYISLFLSKLSRSASSNKTLVAPCAPACTGDPFTCPCESCQAFRRDVEADRAGESDDGRAGLHYSYPHRARRGLP